MPQKKLQLKTVAANMCGLQPGNSGLIQFVKQQSQSIAHCYTLALALFLFVGSFQWLVFYSRSNSSPDYQSKGPSFGILLQSKMFVFYFRHVATNRIITGRSMKNNTPAAVDFQDVVKTHWSEQLYSEKYSPPVWFAKQQAFIPFDRDSRMRISWLFNFQRSTEVPTN